MYSAVCIVGLSQGARGTGTSCRGSSFCGAMAEGVFGSVTRERNSNCDKRKKKKDGRSRSRTKKQGLGTTEWTILSVKGSEEKLLKEVEKMDLGL